MTGTAGVVLTVVGAFVGQLDVITRCVPMSAMATNTPDPNVTDNQPLASAAEWAVHVTPSGRHGCRVLEVGPAVTTALQEGQEPYAYVAS